MSKIFLTGASGFIGGEVLYQLCKKPHSHQVAVLVRHHAKAARIASTFPDVRVVTADLEDAAVIEHEARSADIVLNLAATNHASSARAIARGLVGREGPRPAYWIQISGASLFSAADIAERTYGEARDKVYDDISDAEEIQAMIQKNPNRIVDQLILSQPSDKVKTALLVGPLIYGMGRGPVNKFSIQAPAIARYTRVSGEGFRIGAGKSAWSNIHVHDLGALCLDLVQAAVQSRDGLWNDEGVYLPENGRMTFGELGERIASEAHARGFIKSPTVTKTIDPGDADVVTPHGAMLLATTALLDGQRARQKVGWKPSQPSLKETLSDVVSTEATEKED